MKHRIVIPDVTINAIKEDFEQVHLSGAGKDALFGNQFQGWDIYTSHALFGGFKDKPAFIVGQKISIILEGEVPDAQG